MIFLEFFNIRINHLAQFFFINMTLKWHYINMFEKIDNSVMSNMVFGSFIHDCIRSTFLIWSQNDHNKLPLAIQVSMHQQLQSMLILKP